LFVPLKYIYLCRCSFVSFHTLQKRLHITDQQTSANSQMHGKEGTFFNHIIASFLIYSID
jgi:hypothetical protein